MDPSGDGPFLAAQRGQEKDTIDLREDAGKSSEPAHRAGMS